MDDRVLVDRNKIQHILDGMFYYTDFKEFEDILGIIPGLRAKIDNLERNCKEMIKIREGEKC